MSVDPTMAAVKNPLLVLNIHYSIPSRLPLIAFEPDPYVGWVGEVSSHYHADFEWGREVWVALLYHSRINWAPQQARNSSYSFILPHCFRDFVDEGLLRDCVKGVFRAVIASLPQPC